MLLNMLDELVRIGDQPSAAESREIVSDGLLPAGAETISGPMALSGALSGLRPGACGFRPTSRGNGFR